MFFQPLKRLVYSLLLSVVVATTANARDVSINFIANASLRITDGDYVLFTDFPYVSGAFGHMEYTYPYFVEQDNNVTTLITSRMTDHFDPVTFMTLGWKVIGPAEVVGDLQSRYITLNEERDRVVAELERNRILDQAERPDTEITVILPDPIIRPDTMVVEENLIHGPIHIQAIRTKSAQTEHYSYVLEWGGRKIYLGGDTGDTAHLATLPEVDIAFLSPWLFENARKEDALPNAKKIVIYQHHEGEIIPNCFTCTIPEKGELITFD